MYPTQKQLSNKLNWNLHNNNEISQLQHALDEQGVFTFIFSHRKDKHDLIVNYEVRATHTNKKFLERIIRKMRKKIAPPQ